jgi:hypothetical protein
MKTSTDHLNKIAQWAREQGYTFCTGIGHGDHTSCKGMWFDYADDPVDIWALYVDAHKPKPILSVKIGQVIQIERGGAIITTTVRAFDNKGVVYADVPGFIGPAPVGPTHFPGRVATFPVSR